jgi:hypothetical protein
MNNENQENEALKDPVILTIPASVTVPGLGFLVALNPDWRFTSQERRASPSSGISQEFFAFPHYQRPQQPSGTSGRLTR